MNSNNNINIHVYMTAPSVTHY